jgi:soluble lytic murein transglycosylase-like protein
MLTRFEGNTEHAIRAYNAGPSYVSKVLAEEYRAYPTETVEYTKRVLTYLDEYNQHY